MPRRAGPSTAPRRLARASGTAAGSLTSMAPSFDELLVFDNSAKASGAPEPTTAPIIENGRVTYEADRAARWVATWRAQLPS